jgi:hypothetical protein
MLLRFFGEEMVFWTPSLLVAVLLLVGLYGLSLWLATRH